MWQGQDLILYRMNDSDRKGSMFSMFRGSETEVGKIILV